MARFIEYHEDNRIIRYLFKKTSLEANEAQGEFIAKHLKNWGINYEIGHHQDSVEVVKSTGYTYVTAQCHKGNRRVRSNSYLFYMGILLFEFEMFTHEDTLHHREENLVDSASIKKRNYELQESIMTPELEAVNTVGGEKKNHGKFRSLCYEVLAADKTSNTEMYIRSLE